MGNTSMRQQPMGFNTSLIFKHTVKAEIDNKKSPNLLKVQKVINFKS